MKLADFSASRLRLACGLAALALTPATALAYHPLVTDDTGTQGCAGNQIELGYNSASTREAAAKDTSREVALSYARGLSDSLDVFVGVTRQTKPEQGWGNTALGAKWRFCDNEQSKLSLGIKPELRLPVSAGDEAKGLGQGEVSYALSLLLSQETGFGAVHLNAVAERNGYAMPTADRKHVYRLSVAPVWDVAEHWKLALDAGLQTNPDSSKNARMGFVELGAVYSPTDDLDFSFGIIRDVMDGTARRRARPHK